MAAAPIRVGFVGLSTQPFPQGWSQATHLPYLKANPDKYVITAVLNSGLASSQAAIEKFGLSSAKAFGDLDDFVNYEGIDLVVCCTDVAQHHEPVKKALERSKPVFVEWPLSSNADQARELVKIAEEKNLKTFTCLETPVLPVTLKLRSLVEGGAIGSLISSNFHAVLPPTGPAWSEHASFYLQVESGQSPLHCRVAHPLDAFLRVVGEFETFNSEVVTHQKTIRLYEVPVADLASVAQDPESKPYKQVPRTSPDEVFIQGRLTSGALASLHFHTGADFLNPDGSTSNLRWIIHGTEGDIYITQTSGALLRDASAKIQLVKGKKAEDIPIDWEKEGDFKMFGDWVVLATPGRHYRTIAEGWGKEEGYGDKVVDFRKGLERLELLEKIVKGCYGVVKAGDEKEAGKTEAANGSAGAGDGSATKPVAVSNGTAKVNGEVQNGAVVATSDKDNKSEAKKKRRKSSVWKILGFNKD